MAAASVSLRLVFGRFPRAERARAGAYDVCGSRTDDDDDDDDGLGWAQFGDSSPAQHSS